MPMRDAPVLLVGQVFQKPQPVLAYEDGRRTDRVRAYRVLVLVAGVSGESGASDVTIPVEEAQNYNLREGASVAWWVRFSTWSQGDRSGGTCTAITPADADTAGIVNDAVGHMVGAPAR